MCETGEDRPNLRQAGTQARASDTCNEKLAEPTLRDRLESRRSRLARQLAEVDLALQLIYTNPDAEKIHAILHNARP